MLGQTVSKAQKDRLDALVDLLSPAHSLDRLDTFGKWLFGGLATVGSLAIGLSVTAFSKPSGLGQVTFVLAVAVLGVSLAIASMALAPATATYNPNSLTDMQRAVGAVVKHRWFLYRLAAVGFAVTLVLAGLTPAADSARIGRQASHLVTSYQLNGAGALTVQVAGQHLQPFTPLSSRIASAGKCPASAAVRPVFSTLTDGGGEGHGSLRYTLPQGAGATVLITWTPAGGHAKTKRIQVRSYVRGARCG